ncbi:DUF3471 domain-containing protein [Spirosoma pollinicola]|uniref:DUF3471 domain-containing protein n=1 Tax=Spirosoma pollinicola TaxID=2057025 RepID=A0A2K8YSU6_9BACT|nr:DUF3471 domain-containing protein [Spirosoma pollinicola]AUD00697.1 DUF3471 domain-containing protein [Spirosoma pollinicola]
MKSVRSLFLLVCLLAVGATANAQMASTDSASLKAYTGIYTFASGSPIQKYTITADKGELYGEADSYGKNKLVKQTKADTFQSTSSYGSMITFVRDAATKAVTSLSIAAQGTELTARKDNP